MRESDCFDARTELLTDEGWKPFPKVRGDEAVLALDGDVAKWGPITQLTCTAFQGHLHLHDGVRVNFCVTGNHPFLVRGRKKTYHRNSRLTVTDGEEIKRRRANGESGRTLAHEYGVSANTIYLVANGRYDGTLRTGAPEASRWSLIAYEELPQSFVVRRTNVWHGSNPEIVVFEQPTIEVVLCGGCGHRIDESSSQERERARAGSPVYHRACRTAASRATVSCSRCGKTFDVPRSQARRSIRFYCPGSTCRTGSSSLADPVSTVLIPEPGPTSDFQPNRTFRRYEFEFIDWAEFLGWYVSEGSTSPIKNSNSWHISLSQMPGAKYEAIANLLQRMNIRFQRGNHDLSFASVQVGKWLRENCGVGSENKKVPACIREASQDAMNRFLYAFGEGDGSRHTHQDSRRYITSSKQLADDLHEMLCKLGRGRTMRARPANAAGTVAVNPLGREFVRRHDIFSVMDPGAPVDSDVLKKNVTKVYYDGYVYSISIPYRAVMVRRRGASIWAGPGAVE